MRDRTKRAFLRLPPGIRRSLLHRLGRYAPWEEGFDFTPPPRRPGEVTGPPDFVGIGVQKAGTTWWYQMILGHPGIASSERVHKERHFLDRFGASPMRPDDVERYYGWFPRRPGELAGEWTPDYFSFPWGPKRLRSAAPDARLLLLLRDPVERFRSGLAHLARMGSSLDPRAVADAVERGFYERTLASWLECFDEGQLLVLQYERCLADRDAQLERTFAHLGLDPYRPTWPVNGAAEREAARPALDDEVRAYLVELYEPDVLALAARLPTLELTRWPNFAYLASGPKEPGRPSAYSPTERP